MKMLNTAALINRLVSYMITYNNGSM